MRNQPQIFVGEFRFTNNSAFSSRRLSELLSGYTNSLLDDQKLEEARQKLTWFYITNGYYNSGAVLPDQVVTNRSVLFEIREGTRPEVHVHGTKSLKEEWVRQRIEYGVGEPLNVNRLRDTLQTLRENPNIRRITADLQPKLDDAGRPRLGGSDLDVQVEEARPYYLALQVDNYRPVSVGAEVFDILAGHYNLTRHGDALELDYGLLQRSTDSVEFSGLDNLGISYRIPVTVADTTLGAFYDRRNFAVIEEPFNELDIDSQYYAWGVRLAQPLYRRARRELALTLSFERRHSESTLLGEPFSFSPGSINGEADVCALRLSLDGAFRGAHQSLAFRLTTSLGLDMFEATKNGTERDGEFVSLLGQAQYLRHLWQTTNHALFPAGRLVVRGGFQWANEPLLAIEQLSLGGHATVRGYRENQLVRDRGVFGNLELQAVVLQDRRGNDVLQLIPFFDVGAGWDYLDYQGAANQVNEITSVGLAAALSLGGHFHARVDWGYAFRDLVTSRENLQDYGVSFSLMYKAL